MTSLRIFFIIYSTPEKEKKYLLSKNYLLSKKIRKLTFASKNILIKKMSVVTVGHTPVYLKTSILL